MIQTIRVASKPATDPYGQDVLAEVHRTVGLPNLQRVRTALGLVTRGKRRGIGAAA